MRLDRLVEWDRLDEETYQALTHEWQPMSALLDTLQKRNGYMLGIPGLGKTKWRWPKLLDSLKRMRARGTASLHFDETLMPPQYQVKKGPVIA
jgi:hypothetical protein